MWQTTTIHIFSSAGNVPLFFLCLGGGCAEPNVIHPVGVNHGFSSPCDMFLPSESGVQCLVLSLFITNCYVLLPVHVSSCERVSRSPPPSRIGMTPRLNLLQATPRDSPASSHVLLRAMFFLRGFRSFSGRVILGSRRSDFFDGAEDGLEVELPYSEFGDTTQHRGDAHSHVRTHSADLGVSLQRGGPCVDTVW